MHIYFLNITDGITLLVYSKKLKNNYCKCHYTDGFTNGTGPSVYSKELENNYCKCHCYC